ATHSLKKWLTSYLVLQMYIFLSDFPIFSQKKRLTFFIIDGTQNANTYKIRRKIAVKGRFDRLFC
ncbi:hypothetical protein, partial [Alloprevotella tannerae]|uniref:hypothetical protein n=1 Tax=Alloprevotella tannerae TaxID=76122 RepID=UPI0028E4AF9E